MTQSVAGRGQFARLLAGFGFGWLRRSVAGPIGLAELLGFGMDRIGIYASKSVFPWNLTDAKTWVAQYADMNATGYQDAPWNEGAYDCAIRQYSSCGRLDGWAAPCR